VKEAILQQEEGGGEGVEGWGLGAGAGAHQATGLG
jgi:hypothetical protein